MDYTVDSDPEIFLSNSEWFINMLEYIKEKGTLIV